MEDSVCCVCCICLDNENEISTIKCSQCVNWFHSGCIVSWAFNRMSIINWNIFNNITCPCCRIIIDNNIIRLNILYKMIIHYKYILLGISSLISLFLFIFGLLFYYYSREFIIVLVVNTIGFSMAGFIDSLCKQYNIDLINRSHFS
jgi:hypothetical protein